MAFLRRKLDGGYIIKTRASSFTTLQVSKEGIAFLSQFGIEEDSEVPRPLLRYMLATGLVFTIRSIQRPEEDHSSLSPPTLLTEDVGPRMAIREDQNGWHLVLLFPELPAAWIREIFVDASSTAMQTCGFYVDGMMQTALPMTKLWPGKGGVAWPVIPHVEPYTIEPVGLWPSNWDLRDWTKDVKGLQTTGVFFNGEEKGGVILKEGKALIAGVSYYFIVHIDSCQTLVEKSIFPLPPEVQPRSLGLLRNWEAWAIQMPSAASSSVYDWCNQINHPLEKALWKLELISPPPLGYSADGAPIVESGMKVIVAAIPPSPLSEKTHSPELLVTCNNLYLASVSMRDFLLTKELRTNQTNSKQNSPFYFALETAQNGKYRLQPLLGRVAPLTFTAMSPEPLSIPEALLNKPLPLQVLITDCTSQILLQSFDHTLREKNIFHIDLSRMPLIDVRCPIPVNVSWSYGTIFKRIQAVDPKDVFSSIEDHLHIAAATNEMFTLYLDADNFGSLHLRFLAQEKQDGKLSPSISSGAVTLEVTERMRWLSSTLPALLHQGATIPIPRALQAVLSQLKDWPQGAQLARLTHVPRALLPHLTALARVLDLHKQELSSRVKE
jgi:hypothetical protein